MEVEGGGLLTGAAGGGQLSRKDRNLTQPLVLH